MFVAWRDLRFARGRFALITVVVVLITVLVGFLSGLTSGLADQNISAVEGLAADRIVFSAPADGADLSFSDSGISAEQLAQWRHALTDGAVSPIGISMGKVVDGDKQASVAFWGIEKGMENGGSVVAPERDGEVVLSQGAAESLEASEGDEVRIADQSYSVSGIAGDAWYSHTPVVWMTLADWQAYGRATGVGGAAATVLAVSGAASQSWSEIDANAGTLSTSVSGSLSAIGAFSSENGSLNLMIAMLYGISALVIGSFFVVWTIQRSGDIAILKALGASTWSLVRDAVGQALIVLVLGVTIGIGLTALFGMVAKGSVPFVISPGTTVIPGLAMIGLGMVGAAFALRTVVSSDPLTALGSNR
ncbi:MAG: ABC transporter permease [Thermomicrobiales bacterium]